MSRQYSRRHLFGWEGNLHPVIEELYDHADRAGRLIKNQATKRRTRNWRDSQPLVKKRFHRWERHHVRANLRHSNVPLAEDRRFNQRNPSILMW